jgi:hypothetical protein
MAARNLPGLADQHVWFEQADFGARDPDDCWQCPRLRHLGDVSSLVNSIRVSLFDTAGKVGRDFPVK